MLTIKIIFVKKMNKLLYSRPCRKTDFERKRSTMPS